MGRENKMRRIELTNKFRVLCNFCDRSELKPHEQDQEALSSMESELKRLRLLTRRMTGTDLHGLSFTELVLLDNHLTDILLIVQNQKKKVKLQEDERLHKQIHIKSSVPCKSSGNSSGDRPHKRDDEVPGREFERRNAKSTQSEFERLFLLNDVKVQTLEPRWEQMARQRKEESMSLLAEQETCSLDNDDRHRDIALRFGSQHSLLSVSRKLRRFQNHYHRKNRPEMR